jgi:hypothetical protein
MITRKIGSKVNLSITVKTDNLGAMFMASSGVRTRHIDTHYHNVRELGRRNYQYQISQIN